MFLWEGVKKRSLCVAHAGLELVLYSRLALNLQEIRLSLGRKQAPKVGCRLAFVVVVYKQQLETKSETQKMRIKTKTKAVFFLKVSSFAYRETESMQ